MNPFIFEGDPPKPVEGLHETGPAPFLTKTFEMVNDPNTNHIVSWSRGGTSFVIWDLHSFSTFLLSRHFRHNNFSSFIRQLNSYGFRKIEAERWEFANEAFLVGQRQLLKSIKRLSSLSSSSSSSSPSSHEPCIEFSREKQMLILELLNLRQQRETTKSYLKAMEQRIQVTEKKQSHMMSFLVRLMHNPSFLQQLLKQRDKRLKEIEDEAAKSQRDSSLSELEALALEIQGYGKQRNMKKDGDLGIERELDDGFWEELLSNESFSFHF